MEFWLLGSTLGPKTVSTQLSSFTGFAPIPSYNSLGFHFCKWEYNTAEMMIERNANFTATKFPVDVLWSDIEYAENHEYFVWNATTFPQVRLNALNSAIQ
jgi:mannosyl-oligosaccharide alpha-1,3-glucosidase